MKYKEFKERFDYHDPPYSFFYKYVKRPFLYPVTWALCHTPIHPNVYSYTGFICAMIAALFFSHGTHAAIIAGLVFFFLYEFCDDFDGISARFKGIKSRHGGWLDILSGCIGKMTIIGAIALGVFRMSGDSSYLIAGIIAVLGIATYNTIDHVSKIRFSTVVQKKLKFEEVKPDPHSLAGKLTILSEIFLNIWPSFLVIGVIINKLDWFIIYNALYYPIYATTLFFYISHKYKDR